MIMESLSSNHCDLYNYYFFKYDFTFYIKSYHFLYILLEVKHNKLLLLINKKY
jgi:hypothetical protein